MIRLTREGVLLPRGWRAVVDVVFVVLCVAAPLVASGFAIGRWVVPAPSASSEPEVYFVPGPACRDAAVRVVNGARHRIRLSAYTLSSPPILAALKAAHERGVDVELLLDRVNDHRSADDMRAAGIQVFLDEHEPINHEKMVTADGDVTILGSANWSPSSERDHEVCVISRDAALAAKVEADWSAHAAHSEAR